MTTWIKGIIIPGKLRCIACIVIGWTSFGGCTESGDRSAPQIREVVTSVATEETSSPPRTPANLEELLQGGATSELKKTLDHVICDARNSAFARVVDDAWTRMVMQDPQKRANPGSFRELVGVRMAKCLAYAFEAGLTIKTSHSELLSYLREMRSNADPAVALPAINGITRIGDETDLARIRDFARENAGLSGWVAIIMATSCNDTFRSNARIVAADIQDASVRNQTLVRVTLEGNATNCREAG